MFEYYGPTLVEHGPWFLQTNERLLHIADDIHLLLENLLTFQFLGLTIRFF